MIKKRQEKAQRHQEKKASARILKVCASLSRRTEKHCLPACKGGMCSWDVTCVRRLCCTRV